MNNTLRTLFITSAGKDNQPYVSVRVTLRAGTSLFGKTVTTEESREFGLVELPLTLQRELLDVWRKVEVAVQ